MKADSCGMLKVSTHCFRSTAETSTQISAVPSLSIEVGVPRGSREHKLIDLKRQPMAGLGVNAGADLAHFMPFLHFPGDLFRQRDRKRPPAIFCIVAVMRNLAGKALSPAQELIVIGRICLVAPIAQWYGIVLVDRAELQNGIGGKAH